MSELTTTIRPHWRWAVAAAVVAGRVVTDPVFWLVAIPVLARIGLGE